MKTTDRVLEVFFDTDEFWSDYRNKMYWDELAPQQKKIELRLWLEGLKWD